MSSAVQCDLCGVIFAPFSGDADLIVRAFNAHPCMSARRMHPSASRPAGGAA